MSRTAEIKLTIDLDGENLPTVIEWEATESRGERPARCESMMLSLWDSDEKTTASIDLWTRDMTIDDMNHYFYQVIHKMADTYQRATGNGDVAKVIHEFGNEFGTNLGLNGNQSAGEQDRHNESIDLISLAAANDTRSPD